MVGSAMQIPLFSGVECRVEKGQHPEEHERGPLLFTWAWERAVKLLDHPGSS